MLGFSLDENLANCICGGDAKNHGFLTSVCLFELCGHCFIFAFFNAEKVTNFIAGIKKQTIGSYNPSSHLAQLKHGLSLLLFLPLALSQKKREREIDFCLEFVKSGTVVPVNGAPCSAG